MAVKVSTLDSVQASNSKHKSESDVKGGHTSRVPLRVYLRERAGRPEAEVTMRISMYHTCRKDSEWLQRFKDGPGG